jgi:hypothetical protein
MSAERPSSTSLQAPAPACRPQRAAAVANPHAPPVVDDAPCQRCRRGQAQAATTNASEGIHFPAIQVPSDIPEASPQPSMTASSPSPSPSPSPCPPSSRSTSPTLSESTHSGRSQSPQVGSRSKSKRHQTDRSDIGADVKTFFRVDSNSDRHCLFCEYVVICHCYSSFCDLSLLW